MKRALVLALLAVTALVSCAPPHQREANRMVQEGRFLEAAGVWLTALEADTADPLPRKKLAVIAPNAYSSTLDLAREHEASNRLDESLVVYREVEAFLTRLKGVDALGFPVEDVAGERASTEERLATRYYDDGVAAFEGARYLDAIASWDKARKLRPEFRDTTARTATALHLQAVEDLGAKRYADALARFELSHALDQNALSAGWAASIHAAWGRALLKQGECRGAWDHLEAAKENSLDARLGEDLEAARRCARVELIVTPFEDLTGEAVPGTAIGAVLSDDMEAQLRASGSVHLRLLDGASAPAAPAAADGQRYQVRGRVTRYTVDQPEDLQEERTAAGRILVECEAAQSDRWTEQEGFVCEQPVQITYRHHTKRLVVNLGASLKVVDGRAEQRLTQTIEAKSISESFWADGFAMTGQPVKIGSEPGLAIIAVDAELLALSGPPRALEPQNTLVGRAVRDLANQASQAVLSSIDAKPSGAPPAWLDVKPPAIDAEEIQFAPAPSTSTGAEPI